MSLRVLQLELNKKKADLEIKLGDPAKDLVGQELTVTGRKVRVASADGDGGGGVEGINLDEDGRSIVPRPCGSAACDQILVSLQRS